MSLKTELKHPFHDSDPMDKCTGPDYDEFKAAYVSFSRQILEKVEPGPSGQVPGTDIFVTMRRIQILEKGIKAGMVSATFDEIEIHQPALHLQLKDHFQIEATREELLEFLKIELLTSIAREKSLLYDLGLLILDKNGDLRTARIIEDGTELRLQLLRFEKFREEPGLKKWAQQAASKLDPPLLARLSRILGDKPGLEINHRFSALHHYLLINWTTSQIHQIWEFMPLCRVSDPVIAEYARIVLNTNPISPAKIRKAWERLGLRKCKKLLKIEF